MSKNNGAQNKTETVTRTVLSKSLALDGDNLTRQQLVKAKGVRLAQIAAVLQMSLIRVHQIVDEHDLPYVSVSTGKRGQPPFEVTGATANFIFTQLDPDGTRTAPKKSKPVHKTTKKAARATAHVAELSTSTEIVVVAQ